MKKDSSKKIQRSTKTFKAKTDPKTGKSTWVEDEDAHSFSYTIEEFEQLIKKGVIPQDLGKHGLEMFKEQLKKSAIVKEMLNKCKEEQRDPTNEDWQKLGRFFKSDKIQIKKQTDLTKFILDNKDFLLEVIEKEGKPKKKFRQSAHYVEQKLSYTKPQKTQPSLFDILDPSTKDKIKSESVQYIGIKLTPPENSLVNALSRMLGKKSQTSDPNQSDFYKGNGEPHLVGHQSFKLGKKEKVKQKGKVSSAVIRFKKSELLNEYYGHRNHAGTEIKYLDRLFSSFLEKKWLSRYKRVVTNKKGNSETFFIEDYHGLAKLLEYFPGLSEEEAKKVEKGNQKIRDIKGEYILALHPILTDQIDLKYIDFPEDIDYMTKIAAGSHLSVSDAVIRLRDWLISELSAGRKEQTINEETLIHRLHLEKHLKSRKKDRIKSQIQKAIQVSQNLGIILDVEEGKGVLGQKKYTFKLNKAFYH